ncbi:kinase-like protein, partial [Rhizophagus irregularis]
FVPYDQFKNIEFIAEGGFSKIYKATWIDGPVYNYSHKISSRQNNYTVVLKKLNNSSNISSKELNELKIFYELSSKQKYVNNVAEYFGITQDPNSQDIMIIMPYYNSGDLIHYITKDFYNINWNTKLAKLISISSGLSQIHKLNIIHRDFHSGNIFFNETLDKFVNYTTIGDLGISKSATESEDDNNNENYGIIPYMAPEVFQGQKYTKASDIYKCWHSDPDKRPRITDIEERINEISNNGHPTEIIKSSDIGPVTKNNPGAIYKSRPLSAMINSAMSLRSSRSQSEKVKRKFEDDLIEDNDDGRNIKRNKLYEDEEYLTKEIKLDIDTNYNNNEYITTEIDCDI